MRENMKGRFIIMSKITNPIITDETGKLIAEAISGTSDTKKRIKELEQIVESKADKSLITYVTPQMFGAKGDGVTDDTEAFKAALSKNTTVYIPQGIYVISDTLGITDQTPFVGESMVRTKLSFKGENSILLKFMNDRCILRDVQLLGSFTIAAVGTTNTNTALHLNGKNYHKIENLYIKGFNYGIYAIPNAYGTYIKNAEVQSCNYGLDSSSEFNSVTIDTCIFTFCDIAIRLGQGRSQNVLNCDIERNRIGVVKNSEGNCLIQGCYFENCDQYAIQMSWGRKPVDEMIISNNSFYSGRDYRGTLIAYHGNASSKLKISDNCMQSSVPAEGATIANVNVLEPYAGTAVIPYFENNWYSDNHQLSSSSVRLNAMNGNAEYYYASTETDLSVIVSDNIKRVRFLFDETKTIKLPILSNLKRANETIEFFAFGNNNQQYMTIENNPQRNGYSIAGISKIYPNRIYKALFNRKVNNQYDEIIVFGGDVNTYTSTEIDEKLQFINEKAETAKKNKRFVYAAEETDFREIVTDETKNFRFIFNPEKAIIMPNFSELQDKYEPIKFYTVSFGDYQESDTMTIQKATDSYNVIGITAIHPNKIYTATFNRIAENNKEEIIVVEG